MAVYGRIELPSRPWQGRILADERIDHIILKFKVYLFGAPRRTRTFVTLVNNNQQLCQLSYRGINHEGGNPHIIYGLDAFGQFCRIFHHHHVSHASTALFYGAVCNALFHLSPFLLIGGDSISSEKFLKRLAIHKKSSWLNLPLVAYLGKWANILLQPRIAWVDSDASAFILLFTASHHDVSLLRVIPLVLY